MAGERVLDVIEMSDHQQLSEHRWVTAPVDDEVVLDVVDRPVVIDKVTISWSGGTPASNIKLSKAPSGTAPTSGTGVTNSLTISGLSAHTTYEFEIDDTENVLEAGERLGVDVAASIGTQATVMQIYWRSARR